METPKSVNHQGRLIVPEDSIAKLAIVFSSLIKEAEISVLFIRDGGKQIEVNVFVDQVLRIADKEEYLDIYDIFLHRILSEYDGFRASGYVVSLDQSKCPIEILYLSTGEFGVYKIDTESKYLNPRFN
jgi:hypothetical protein